jgi:fructose-bisphosphate aldolase class II
MHGSSSVPKEFIDLINKYGGSMPNAMGVPEEQIHAAVTQYGVCKVNIDTDLRLALTAKIREVFATKPAEFDPRNYLGPGREAIIGMVKRKLHMLNSVGKAEGVIHQSRPGLKKGWAFGEANKRRRREVVYAPSYGY